LYTALYKTSTHFSYLQPLSGGTLTEGVIGSPRFINPLLAANATDEELVSLIYSGLVKIDGDVFSPDLATYTISADGSRYTFTLSPDAKFSDNTPVTADDVLFTYGLVQQGLGSPALGAAIHTMQFEKIDERTISIVVPPNISGIARVLSLGILPAHIWSGISAAEMRDAPQELDPVGSGPFTLTRILSKDGVPSSIILKRNPHALIRPRIAHYIIEIFANENALNQALKKNVIDFSTELTLVPAEFTDPKSQYMVQTLPTRTEVALYALTSSSFFSDSALRSAFSTAIDRNELIATIENGYGSVSSKAADSSPLSSKTFDELIASHVLVRSSVNGALSRSGVPINIAIVVESGTKENAVANAIRDQLAAQGIRVDIRAYDSGTWRSLISSKTAAVLITSGTTDLEGYGIKIPLYTRLQPIVIKKDLPFFNTASSEIGTFYNSAATWYVKQERLWNFFKKT
jgi:peptide/nickel transport system substrate-binding protein